MNITSKKRGIKKGNKQKEQGFALMSKTLSASSVFKLI